MTFSLVARFALADPGIEPVAARLPCAASPDPFTWRWAPATAPAGGVGEMALWIEVPEGAVLYAASLDVTPIRTGGIGVAAPRIPEGVLRRDENGAVVDGRRVLDGTVSIAVPLRAPTELDGLVSMTLAVTHEGCLAGRCWPRRTDWLDVFVDVVTVGDLP